MALANSMALSLLLLFTVSLSFVGCSCPNYWTSFEESCYSIIQNPSTWAEAAEICREFNSNLVTVETRGENEFLKSLITKENLKTLWLGANDLLSKPHWMWENGESLSYTNWYPGEPNNNDNVGENCVEIYTDAFLWNDQECSDKNFFICEKPEETTSVIG